ncbi:hypothetical protein CEUSTIGMA_g1073.t1 [Chlamydomonas eustigma]|uniref:Major facilitator superfamily (MFS) profile domain-containing protein n=1 Tax=Chlamydomonas eustigma TaxID=1157962 RepID=A0A250WSI3_9CHLO|nr:hypothetical protein CEUSTIGMA_g1073.t1 [Chlamydomonas eustigma]|eukprot:GAX73622.1 hypothetical protein CEUSTIGMA_g1073.t1 [Chlamydomonas eustigma]
MQTTTPSTEVSGIRRSMEEPTIEQHDMYSPSSAFESSRTSIYSLWPRRQRCSILLAISLGAVLVSFSDTIYLRALQDIQQNLNTTDTLVATSVAIYYIYLFSVGISALVWGPASDFSPHILPLLPLIRHPTPTDNEVMPNTTRHPSSTDHTVIPDTTHPSLALCQPPLATSADQFSVWPDGSGWRSLGGCLPS